MWVVVAPDVDADAAGPSAIYHRQITLTADVAWQAVLGHAREESAATATEA